MKKLSIFIISFFGFLLTIVIITSVYIFFAIRPTILENLKKMPQLVQQQIQNHHGSYTKSADINKYVLSAAIASQNERFYTDSGISLQGTLRALIFSLLQGKRQGASTITEQLAKNVYFYDKDNLKTDILTKMYSLFITQTYSKHQVLEMYLNDIYFGKQAYGIASASRKYFNTTPSTLTLSESAYLIGVINAPSYYAIHTQQAKGEAITVLSQMEREKFISAIQEKTAEKMLQQM